MTQLNVFDDRHYAKNNFSKIVRSFELAPQYYFADLPQYLRNRKKFNLPLLDFGAFINPMRELHRKVYVKLPLPNNYSQALQLLEQSGLRVMLPPSRVEGLVAMWWQTHMLQGDVIECGSYEGATALLIAILGKLNDVDQKVHALDTFEGTPDIVEEFDGKGTRNMFDDTTNRLEILTENAKKFGVLDRLEIHKGLFQDTFNSGVFIDKQFSLVHIDANIYQSTLEACSYTIPKLTSSGIVVFDDYNGLSDLGARLAIDQYLSNRNISPKALASCSAYIIN